MTANQGGLRGAHTRPRGVKRTRSLRITLPTADQAVGLARQATRNALATWQLAHMEETVVLLVSELVTNAVRHARGTLAIAKEFQTERTWLRIEVQDADPRADVVILDLELGGKMITDEIFGLAATGRRIVVFPAHANPAVVLAVLDAGACGFVTKDEGTDHLVGAVLAVVEDRSYVTRSQAKAMLAGRRSGRPTLSAKERQALLLWFQGMSKASVARRMSITENTVRQYIKRARMKYANAGRPAPSKDALLARAIEDGIIRPTEVTPYTSYATRATAASTGTDLGAHPGRRGMQPAAPPMTPERGSCGDGPAQARIRTKGEPARS
jgi:two-component system, NarL family, nitrate/nitrite response regulator NarL